MCIQEFTLGILSMPEEERLGYLNPAEPRRSLSQILDNDLFAATIERNIWSRLYPRVDGLPSNKPLTLHYCTRHIIFSWEQTSNQITKNHFHHSSHTTIVRIDTFGPAGCYCRARSSTLHKTIAFFGPLVISIPPFD